MIPARPSEGSARPGEGLARLWRGIGEGKPWEAPRGLGEASRGPREGLARVWRGFWRATGEGLARGGEGLAT